MRKPAFTLIETLIALSIVVVVLGASVSANRVILISSQLTSERTQMSALIDESISSLQLLQHQAQTSLVQLGDVSIFGIVAGNPAQKNVIMYAAPALTVSSPITQLVCTTSIGGCQGEKNPVSTDGNQLLMSSMLAGNPDGELIAVSRTPTNQRQILSMESRLQSDNNAVILNAGDPNTLKNWDFYVRSIKVVRLSAGAWYTQPINPGHTQVQARNGVYQVTIKISKYLTPTTPYLTRTIILTDN